MAALSAKSIAVQREHSREGEDGGGVYTVALP